MISRLRSLIDAPAAHIALLTGAIAVSFFATTAFPMDDHFHYQQFIETLAHGRLDLSIPGFHGASILAVPVYWLTQSPLTNIYFQLLCGLLIIPVGYLAAQSLLRDRVAAILFAYALALSPFLFYGAFRGFTAPSFILFFLLSIWLVARGSSLAALPLGISFLIRPFSIALAPLVLFWSPQGSKKSSRRGWMILSIALLFPVIYCSLELAQTGRIIVGAHPDLDPSQVFVWSKIPLNVLHGVQMLFSVHNYYFPDPAKTGPGNLVHTSSLLMIFGVFSLLAPATFWKDRRLARAMGLSVIAAYVLPSLLDHMDHYYLHAAVLLLMLAALPVLRRFPLLVPFVLLTFVFPWLYAWLQYHEVFALTPLFFAVPAVTILSLFVFGLLHPREISAMLRPLWDTDSPQS